MDKKKTVPSLPKQQEIQEKKREFPVLSVPEAMKVIIEKCGETESRIYGSGADTLIILPKAWKELHNMLDWGETTAVNYDEQLYKGIGHYLKTPDHHRLFIASHFFKIYPAKRTPTSACIDNGEYNPIMKLIEYEKGIYNKREKDCNRSFDGFIFDPFVDEYGISESGIYGHTHPNLGCFFSTPDYISGFATKDLPAITLVADPVRKDMKAMTGIENTDTRIIVFSYLNKISDKEGDPIPVLGKRKAHFGLGNAGKAETIITNIGISCNELLSDVCGSRGIYKIYRTISGAQRLKVDIQYKTGKPINGRKEGL